MKTFNPHRHKNHSFQRRPAYGIAPDYRIYLDDTPTPNFKHAGGLFVILISLMALLSGIKTAVKLGAILWRHYTTPLRADLLEIACEQQLRRGRYPRPLIAAYLPQIADNNLPVAVFRLIDDRVICRRYGTLTRTGETYLLTGTADTLPCRFTAAEVRHLFAAPDIFGDVLVIAVN